MTRTAKKKKNFFFFYFRHFFTPGKGPKYGHFGADRLFSDARTCWVVREDPPPQQNLTQKHQEMKKSHRLWGRTHEMVSVIITEITYGTEEVYQGMCFCLILFPTEHGDHIT